MSEASSSQDGQIVLGPAEVLDYIRNQPVHEQALAMLTQFWGLIPQGNALEVAAFDLYRELRQRNHVLDHPNANAHVHELGGRNLSIRIASLGITMLARFQEASIPSDLELSILSFREAIMLMGDSDMNRPAVLANMGSGLLLRFELSGSTLDLEEAITYHRQCLALTPPDSSSLSIRLRSLGLVLRHRFEQFSDINDLENALSNIKQALSAMPFEHPHRPMCLNDLGQVLRNRFNCFGDLSDIEEAVSSDRQSLAGTPDGDPQAPERLNGLAMSLHARYKHSGQTSDLDEAQLCFERALRMTPNQSRDKPIRLHNLATLLQSRFERFTNQADLDDAISLHQSALNVVPESSRLKLITMNGLSTSLKLRFEYLGDVADIQTAIAYQRNALSLLPEIDHRRPPVLSQLGSLLVSLSQYSGSLDDLGEAIELQLQASALTSDADVQRPDYLSNLCSSLLGRYERMGRREDVDKAVDYGEQAIQLTTDTHIRRALRLSVLAAALSRRYETYGKLEDIQKAIYSCRLAVSITRDNDKNKSQWLNNLGSALSIWFNNSGQLALIDEAISVQEQAIQLSEYNSSQKAQQLSNLGDKLLARFERLGDRKDVDRSVTSYWLGIKLIPVDRPRAAEILSGIGNALRVRFERFRQQSDLGEAIGFHRQALALTPDKHIAQSGRLNNLANSLMNHEIYLGEASGLDEAISLYRQAIMLTDDSHTRLPTWLNNLGISLVFRYERLTQVSDLEEGIGYLEKANSGVPDTLPEKSRWLRNLAYGIQFQVARDPTNVAHRQSLLNTLFHAHQITAASPVIRMESARHLSAYAAQFKFNPLVAYTFAMEAIPKYVWFGTSVKHRHQMITNLRNLASEAAAEAIAYKKYDLALEWLEQGRSIIWGQMLKLRTPFDELRQVDCDLADRLENISSSLELASNAHPGDASPMNPEETTQRQHQLANEWEDLVERARKLPSLEDFLKPLKQPTLVKAAHSSTVIILNIHSTRCDALAVVLNSQSVIHVPLPELSYSVALELSYKWKKSLQSSVVRERGFKKNASNTEAPKNIFQDILAVLWSSVVHPILDRLGLLSSGHQLDERPRVTWCATGPLSFLPLHAAGVYQSNSKEKTSEYVISSYTPTLSALLTAPLSVDNFRGIIGVGQATTQGTSALPGTIEELNQIEKHSNGLRMTRLEGLRATHVSVLDGMHDHSWVHLACHASQNSDEPTSSAFYLHDRPLDLATISRAPFKNAGLAFLSACQTATGVEELSEEAVHLAAGLLMSGYPSVIATMWSVRDQDAPLVADRVYARILGGRGPSAEHAARALDDAVGYLREQVGEQNFEAWAPYVHIGL